MIHSRTLNDKINKIHERALGIVYNDDTSSFDELLRKDNSVSIREMQNNIADAISPCHAY